jgi:hypothetical protein
MIRVTIKDVDCNAASIIGKRGSVEKIPARKIRFAPSVAELRERVARTRHYRDPGSRRRSMFFRDDSRWRG